VVSVTGLPPIFSHDPKSPFRRDAPLSENARKYIGDWLTGEGTGQGVQWHSRFGLTSETLSLFEAKASAILNEQLLSARLQAQGCDLVDVSWLANQGTAARPTKPPHSIPDWKKQVAGRNLVPGAGHSV
jgi:hypothetical protein